MKKVIFVVSLFGIMTFIHCNQKSGGNDPESVENKIVTVEAQVARGKYLVETMGCHDCHSPKMMTDQGPVPDPQRLLSGHPASEMLPTAPDPNLIAGYVLFNMSTTAAIGPWGTTFAANLTPHETGLGNWNLEQFGKAVREGKHKGMDNGRMLLPPMPWFNYKELSQNDLKAIWAFLRSVPAVNNVVPVPVPPVG